MNRNENYRTNYFQIAEMEDSFMAEQTLKNVYGLFIDGAWRPASDGAVYTSKNPANGQELAQCAEATR